MYDYSYGTDYGAGFFAFLAAFMVIFVIIGIVLYVIYAIALYKLASNRNIENPWLAWIPIGNLYIMGKLVGSVTIGSNEIKNLEMVYL